MTPDHPFLQDVYPCQNVLRWYLPCFVFIRLHNYLQSAINESE
jgi:hypothetical protein